MGERRRAAIRAVTRSGAFGLAVGALERLAPAGPRTLHVLTYHRVGDPAATPHLLPGLVTVSAAELEAQLDMLVRRANPVDLDAVIDAADGAPLPPRAVHVTFDDAYEDFAELAWPILRRAGVPVTLFVPTGYPDQPARRFWWDRLHHAVTSAPAGATLPTPAGAVRVDDAPSREQARRLLADAVRRAGEQEAEELLEAVDAAAGAPTAPNGVLGWQALRDLAAAGVALANHTRTHPVLPNLSDARVQEEVALGHDDLRARLGEGPPVLAYPGGFHDDRVVALVREGACRVAFTTADGANLMGATDPHRLHRLNVGGLSTPGMLRVRMVPAVANAVARVRRPG